MVRYKIIKLAVREEPWKLIVHRLEYKETKAETVVHKLEYGEYPEPFWDPNIGAYVKYWLEYDVETKNTPDHWDWWIEIYDVEGIQRTIVSESGSKRVSGRFNWYRPIDRVRIPYAGDISVGQLPIYEETFEGPLVYTTVYYHVELRDCYKDTKWRIGSEEMEGPGRLTGSYTIRYKQLISIKIVWKEFRREELPIYEQTFEGPYTTRFLDYDIYVESLEDLPIGRLWLSWMDSETHGFLVARTYRTGRLSGSFNADGWPLHHIAIMADDTVVERIYPHQLPIGTPLFEIVRMAVTPETATAGETFTAVATVKNSGGAGGQATVRFTLNGTVLGEKSVWVDAGEEKEVSLYPSAPSEPGTYNVCAELV